MGSNMYNTYIAFLSFLQDLVCTLTALLYGGAQVYINCIFGLSDTISTLAVFLSWGTYDIHVNYFRTLRN